MPEPGDGAPGREGMLSRTPGHIGAVFRTGGYGLTAEAYGWEGIINVYDIRNPVERYKWCFDNIAKLGGAYQWKPVLNDWFEDMDQAKNKAVFLGADRRELEEGVKETKRRAKDMVAVTAAARAMETSNGSAAAYFDAITMKTGLDAGTQWADEMLQNDPSKFLRVIEDPVVNFFYRRIIQDSGLTVLKEWETAPDPDKPGKVNITQKAKYYVRDADMDRARNGNLARYLKNKAALGGFDGYIDSLIEEHGGDISLTYNGERIDDARNILRGAAKLACDAFLVDKYTRWEYLIDEANQMQLQPKLEWGGSPFRLAIEPAFLADKIKNVYADEGEVIIQIINEAFRPTDVFIEGTKFEDQAVLPTAIEGLSKSFRFYDALWKFVGGSTATALPKWDNETIGKLAEIAELLNQVYGGLKIKPDELSNYEAGLEAAFAVRKKNYGAKEAAILRSNLPGDFPVGKHIVGRMMAHMLLAKSLSSTSESEVNMRDYMRILFGEKDMRTRNEAVQKFIYGENLDATEGFLASLIGPRLGLVLKNNVYSIDREMGEISEIMKTNAQNPKDRRRLVWTNRVGFLVDLIPEVDKIFFRGGGRR